MSHTHTQPEFLTLCQLSAPALPPPCPQPPSLRPAKPVGPHGIAMFFGVGADARKPTYFELLAADRLMPSLKARSRSERREAACGNK